MMISPAWLQPGSDSQSGRVPYPGRAAQPRRDLPLRIAVVEDEVIIAWSLEALIGDLGHEVVGIYADGEQALAGIDCDETDVVLMDINLGGAEDGIEVAQKLCQGTKLRVLFISAYADAGTGARIAKTVPGAPLLRKPISSVQLAAHLAGDRKN